MVAPVIRPSMKLGENWSRGRVVGVGWNCRLGQLGDRLELNQGGVVLRTAVRRRAARAMLLDDSR